MAKGLAALLEEESEHQWLAVGVFALFALAGGWAIHASNDLSGVGPAPVGGAWHGHSVVDIALIDGPWEGAHVALVHTDEGARLYQQTGLATEDVVVLDMSERPTRLMPQADGSVWWDAAVGEIRGVKSGEYLSANTGLDEGKVLDLVLTEDDLTYGLLLVEHGVDTSVVAFDGLGGEFLPLEAPEGVTWTTLTLSSDGVVFAAGWRAAEGGNPASPSIISTVAVLEHDAGALNISVGPLDGPDGMPHSVLPTEDGHLMVATRAGVVDVDAEGTRTLLELPSTTAALDHRGDLWLVGGADSTALIQWNGETTRTRSLASPLDLQVTISDADGDTWLMFGQTSDGENGALMVDLEHETSPLSGRGFLDLVFLLVGIISLGGLFTTWWKQARQTLV